MERKSMGSFIAALRRVNGLTQKDLAEKLNASDKSVSRWERDEGAPDLSLIPILAEIFGVTCDELLRGERQSTVKHTDQQDLDKAFQKTDKQQKRILNVSLSKYHNRSLIAVGLAIVGLIVAMTCNFGFNRAYIGFLGGTVFYLASIICQAMCINGAFLSVADDEMASAEVESFKRVVRVGQKVIGLAAVLLVVSLPLILCPTDTYMGLTAESWLLQAFIFGFVGIVISGVVCYFLTESLQKKGVYTLPEKDAATYRHNFKLKRNCSLILLALLLLTLLANAVATGGWNVSAVANGISFDNFDEFKTYMEQDIPEQPSGKNGFDREKPQAAPDSNVHYYDKYGNEISYEESLRTEITDPDGNVVCEYQDRNKSVGSLSYAYSGGTLLSITAFTHENILEGQHKIAIINAGFLAIYLAEVAAMFVVYLKKRAR